MQRFLMLFVLVCLFSCSSNGQSIQSETIPDDDVALKKLLLLSDLQVLETKSAKLDSPLARALGKTEIADAAWTLDQEWAKKLLREAFELTLPSETEQVKSRGKTIGQPLSLPTRNEVARNSVRHRVLEVAGRSKKFVDELIKSGTERVGKQEENHMYENLANKAVSSGDTATAGTYIVKALESDPTIINSGYFILDVALKDRAAADKLILQYIDVLRATPLSASNDGAFRAYYLLENLVFPSDIFLASKRFLHKDSASASKPIPAAGLDVVRAYVGYIVESLGELEQREPGSAMKLRSHLTSAWLPLRQYAPELTGAFIALERKSRTSDDDASLPQESENELSKTRYEDRVKKALDSNQPDELTINFAISRGDFDKARKLLDKLSDGAQKTQLTEMVNMREALSLAAKGNTVEAGILAERLTKAASVMQVYPAIINKCAAKKNEPCVTNAFYQAVKQLKRTDPTPYTPPAGIPASAVAGSKEFDPVLSSLGKLAKAVAPVSEALSMEALDETVQAANRSEIDTGQGRTGFETDIFKMLAPKNELRVLQMAGNLKDPLRQIVALAMIDQWKASELAEKAKALRQKNTANK